MRGRQQGMTGTRITASSNPRARDWKIIEDVGDRRLSEAQEKSRQMQSVLLLSSSKHHYTQEAAERVLWRMNHINNHVGKKYKLEVFWGPLGWQDAPPLARKKVTGINSEWDRGTALTLVEAS